MEKRLIYLLILIVLAGCTTNPKNDPERNILYGIALNPESQYVEIELDGVL